MKTKCQNYSEPLLFIVLFIDLLELFIQYSMALKNKDQVNLTQSKQLDNQKVY